MKGHVELFYGPGLEVMPNAFIGYNDQNSHGHVSLQGRLGNAAQEVRNTDFTDESVTWGCANEW